MQHGSRLLHHTHYISASSKDMRTTESARVSHSDSVEFSHVFCRHTDSIEFSRTAHWAHTPVEYGYAYKQLFPRIKHGPISCTCSCFVNQILIRCILWRNFVKFCVHKVFSTVKQRRWSVPPAGGVLQNVHWNHDVTTVTTHHWNNLFQGSHPA